MTRKQSSLAAVALLAGVVALAVVFLGWPAWQTYQGDAAAIEDGRDKLKRFRALAGQQGELDRQLESMRNSRAVDEMLLPEDTATLAAAKLQEQLKRIVEASGGRLTSTQVLATEPAAGFQKVGVDVRMSVGVAALQQVLHNLEGALPILVIDNLLILARGQRNARRARNRVVPNARTPRPAAPLMLDVRFRLAGFMATDGGGAGAAESG